MYNVVQYIVHCCTMVNMYVLLRDHVTYVFELYYYIFKLCLLERDTVNYPKYSVLPWNKTRHCACQYLQTENNWFKKKACYVIYEIM